MNLLSIGISKYDSLNDSIASDNDAIEIHQNFKRLFPNHINDEQFLHSGRLNKQDFVNSMLAYSSYIGQNNIKLAIFYYSGHAKLVGNTHQLVFSDGDTIDTQDIIDWLKDSAAERILVILDCCYAGAVSVKEQSQLVEQNLISLSLDGIDIFCACSAEKEAYSDEENNLGVFTRIFIDSLLVLSRNKQRGVSIKSLVSMIQVIFENKKLSLPYSQTFNYVYNSVTDYYLIEPQEDKYLPKQVNYYSDNFEIINIDPVHIGVKKRYIINALLNTSPSDRNIINIMNKLMEFSNKVEVYRNSKEEERLGNKSATHLFVYLYLKSSDIMNKNYYARVIWVDEKSNREYFYNDSNGYRCDDYFIINNPNYLSLKDFFLTHTMCDEELFEYTKHLRDKLLLLGRTVIGLHVERLNGKLLKSTYEEKVKEAVNILNADDLDEKIGNIPFPSENSKLKVWIDKIIEINAIVNNIINYITSSYYQKRKEKEMNIILSQEMNTYHKKINELKEIEKELKNHNFKII